MVLLDRPDELLVDPPPFVASESRPTRALIVACVPRVSGSPLLRVSTPRTPRARRRTRAKTHAPCRPTPHAIDRSMIQSIVVDESMNDESMRCDAMRLPNRRTLHAPSRVRVDASTAIARRWARCERVLSHLATARGVRGRRRRRMPTTPPTTTRKSAFQNQRANVKIIIDKYRV
jgi:hypothetical protein